MSRIEEALRRAAQTPAAESRKVDAFKLEEYPREDSSSATPEVHVSREEWSRPRPVAVSIAPAEAPISYEAAAVAREVIPAPVAREIMPVAASSQVGADTANSLLAAPRPAVRAEASQVLAPELVRQCQRLATVLHERQSKQGLKTLAVMSAVGKEGKSEAAVGLALALTRAYSNRVLLIDRNLRHPSMHELVGVSNSSGLSELVRYHREVAPVTVSALLHLLPAGAPALDLTEELISSRMRELLTESTRRYDWVVVDTPAMSVLDEAETVGRLTDGVVFVIGGSTPFPMVQQAIAKLGRPRIVGTILNGVEESPLVS